MGRLVGTGASLPGGGLDLTPGPFPPGKGSDDGAGLPMAPHASQGTE